MTTAQLLTPAEVANKLGISELTLKRMRLAKKGPPAIFVSARTIRYDPDVIADWIAKQTQPNEE